MVETESARSLNIPLHFMSTLPEIKPHPPLSPYYSSLSEKPGFLRSAFDAAAPHYEGIASWGFFGSGHWYRVNALKLRGGLKPGMKCLDVAAGTGPTARAVAAVIGNTKDLTCLEPSAGMIAESKKLLDCPHIQATADSMPLENNSFDFFTMGFALRHVDNLAQAASEFYRVLKLGGRFFIMDVIKPKNFILRQFHKIYFKHILPLLTRLITKSQPATFLMQYYWETMDKMVEPEIVLQTFRDAGFKDTKYHLVLGCFCEYSGIKTS